ncbi:MAG: L,D-transpeptidase [gamma proteobacterium symbiont of Bathyaustriella thionipta]|nr:L,D-transpeptidase [gamma proteobacterium symbiont of Bathyaustriella thionipta]
MTEKYPPSRIEISLEQQRLRLFQAQSLIQEYAVSTALNGAGQQHGSGCTPCGQHRVRIKIGAGCPPGAVFVGRRFSGEIYTPELAQQQPHRDWILTRILWLSGTESGHNRGGHVDTLRRYIYIHGCPDTEPMGIARSHGCIRMRNHDLLQLFPQLARGSRVDIY